MPFSLASLNAATTVDYIVIDSEHGSRSRNDIARMGYVVKSAGLTAIVRVVSTEPIWVAMALDAGADGVLVPYCETLEEIRACAIKLRTHPLKGEAFANVVERDEYPSEAVREYIGNRHKDHLFIVGVESKPAADRIEQILDCGPIDGVFIGPNDMSTSLGIPDQYDNPLYRDTLKRVIDASEGRGVPVMIHHQTHETGMMAIELGARWVLHSSDAGFVRQAANDEFAKLREAASKKWGSAADATAADEMDVV